MRFSPRAGNATIFKKIASPSQAKNRSCSRGFIVSTTLEFAAFGSGPDAKYSRASAFCFFFPQPCVLQRSEHILTGKYPRVYLDRAATDKQLVKYKSYRKSLVFVVVT